MKKFTDYYADEAFRARHSSYMMEKVPCPDGCGTMTARCNMTKHRRTSKHIKFVQNKMKGGCCKCQCQCHG